MSSSLVGQDLQASNLHPNNHGTSQLGQYALVPPQNRQRQPAYPYNAPIERSTPGFGVQEPINTNAGVSHAAHIWAYKD